MNRKIRTWVEISLNDLEHNYREISSRLPDGCQMLGVCKANAYGHGAVRVAQRLQRAGCQWVAGNCYDEAEELRAAVKASLSEMHVLFQRGYTPRVKPTKACRACSLKELCLPRLMRAPTVSAYLTAAMEEPQ